MSLGHAELQPHPFGHPAAMEFLVQAAAGEEAAALAWQRAAEAWQRQSALLCEVADPGGEGHGETPVIEIEDTPSPTQAKEEQEEGQKQEQEEEHDEEWRDGPEEEPPCESPRLHGATKAGLQQALAFSSSGATMPQRPKGIRTPPKHHPRAPIGMAPPAALPPGWSFSIATAHRGDIGEKGRIPEASGRKGASRTHPTPNCQGGKGASQPYARSDGPTAIIGSRFSDNGK